MRIHRETTVMDAWVPSGMLSSTPWNAAFETGLSQPVAKAD
jgi:hypothetical protein